jgi:hypothetical protein
MAFGLVITDIPSGPPQVMGAAIAALALTALTNKIIKNAFAVFTETPIFIAPDENC